MSLYSNDQEIIRDIVEGGRAENRATGYLFNAYYQRSVNHLVYEHQLKEADAEDIYVEAVSAVVFSIASGRFEQRSQIKTFLFSVINRLCLKHFAYKKREAKAFEEYGLIDEDEMIEFPELTEAMQKALQLISDKCRELLGRWSLDKYTMSELLEVMKSITTEAAMAVKKFKCLERLKTQINKNPALKAELKRFV